MAVEDLDTWDYEYDDETGTVRINALGSVYGASIEDYEEVMARVIDIIREVGGVNSVVLSASREYEYPQDQVEYLQEIADAIQDITRQGYLAKENLRAQKCEKYYPEWRQDLQELVTKDLRRDPIGAYVKLRREIRHKREEMEDAYPQTKRCYKYYIHDILKPLRERLEEAQLVQMVEDELTGYHVGDRSLYREIFHPLVRPNFMLTKYMSLPPEQGEEIDRYKIGNDVEVEIYRLPDEAQKVYHINPPEFDLSEEKYTILDAARRYMGEHRPESEEFAKPERMRDVFSNIGRDMLVDIAEQMDTSLSSNELDRLTDILTRYTAGLGVLELLFADEKIQDVYVNSPVGKEPIFIYHADHEECKTNLIPTQDDAESWATRFRIQSGRPLDEANPVLDTELEVPGGRARVAVMTQNLSPEGLAFAFRRHRDEPWTYPLFIKNDFFNPLAAALMSFIIDGGRTMLISGTRSAGKTSLLGASLLELMKKTRIIDIEDTLELPIPRLQDIGYNAERMKARSVITQVESELPAEEALRASLRFGDSAMVLGEVRSDEAKALYEAMRIGAVANFVGGTIHGEDAYAVFDRVVNDLGVPRTSFKATDIIVSANRLRSPSGTDRYRRVTGITEVRKDWQEDPQAEDGFVDLMRYDAEEDELVPTDTLLNGESVVLNRIADNVREWKNDWNAVWDNIQLRKRIKQRMVDLSSHGDHVLEAEFVSKANEKFHTISDEVSEEYGELDSERIYARWNEWAERAAKQGLQEER
ncbi:MAG: type II/IV secretion system ATPase subunit [Candidatus Nanohaloarchaea archaeon]|nr:type II/IV secretion system ATPase subunit [Candidatus Nanohaloarchaea archaeon]